MALSAAPAPSIWLRQSPGGDSVASRAPRKPTCRDPRAPTHEAMLTLLTRGAKFHRRWRLALKVRRRRARSLRELPVLLIEGRIVAGLTQCQLGERLGLSEQQIQRYEATMYSGASLDRLRKWQMFWAWRSKSGSPIRSLPEGHRPISSRSTPAHARGNLGSGDGPNLGGAADVLGPNDSTPLDRQPDRRPTGGRER